MKRWWKDENSIVKQSLKISVDLYHSGQNSFYSSLKKMTDYYDFPGFNCNLLNKCKIKQYVDLLQRNISLTGIIPFNIHKNVTFIIKSKRIIALLPT